MARHRRLDKYSKKSVVPTKLLIIVGFVLVIIVVFILVGMNLGQKSGEIQLDSEKGNFKPQIVDASSEKLIDVKVWVPNEKNKLIPKTVRIVDNKQKLNNKTEALIKLLVSQQILPKNTHLIGNINVEQGVATVNFSEEILSFSGSAQQEANLINSIVKTLINKEDNVEAIKILIAGEEVETLGGHIELEEELRL